MTHLVLTHCCSRLLLSGVGLTMNMSLSELGVVSCRALSVVFQTRLEAMPAPPRLEISEPGALATQAVKRPWQPLNEANGTVLVWMP